MLTPGEPDYYCILGVGREASAEEIKQAYHRLAARYHPDLHPNDVDAEASLRAVNQAYAVLKDPQRRAQYDRWGPWGPPSWRPVTTTARRDRVVSAVQHLLRTRAQLNAHQPRRGRDQRCTLQLTPEACATGCEARLQMAQQRWCPQCQGSRMAAGKQPFPCPQCRGSREIHRPDWLLSALRGCDVCAGTGVIVTDPCRRCAGKGSVQIMRTLAIDVPAGLREGSRLRLAGEGEPGQWGGGAGDLYVDIHIRRKATAATASSGSFPHQ